MPVSESAITIQLTPADLARLVELRKLREEAGRQWLGDAPMVSSIVSRAILDELRDEQAYKEARERGPFSMDPGRGSLDLLMRQAL